MTERVYLVSPALQSFDTRHDAVGYKAVVERRDGLEQEVIPMAVEEFASDVATLESIDVTMHGDVQDDCKFAEYTCGNRVYFVPGEETYPDECPHDGCDGTAGNTYPAQ
jgi:hypothetical protein